MRRLLLLPCLAGCLDPTDEPDGPPPYDAPGPYGVGAAAVPLPLADGDSAMEVWFPAVEHTGDPYPYFLAYTRDALEDATPDCIGARPVALFSHGHGGLRFQSLFLTEHLASHGWIVVAPDHRDNTTFDLDEGLVGRVAVRRPDDLGRAFDALVDLELLAGCVDAAAGYAVLGHSFGGWAALVTAGAVTDLDLLAATCGEDRGWLCQMLDEPEATSGGLLDLSDDRAWATVSHTPAGWMTLGPVGAALLDRPTLILAGTEDTLTPLEQEQQPIYDALAASPRALAVFEGASHYDFSDSCALFPTDEFCSGVDDLDGLQTTVAAVTLAFLERARGADAGTADAWLPPADPTVSWQSP